MRHCFKNLDALADCLGSLEHVGSKHIVLFIRDIEGFLDKEKPEKRAAAIQVIREAQDPKNRYDNLHFRVIGMRQAV